MGKEGLKVLSVVGLAKGMNQQKWESSNDAWGPGAQPDTELPLKLAIQPIPQHLSPPVTL